MTRSPIRRTGAGPIASWNRTDETVGVYQIKIAKDALRFCAAHFATFLDGRCESLHGHNYQVGITLDGKLAEPEGVIVDFIPLKRVIASILEQLDHHTLLATQNPLLKVTESDDEVEIRYNDRRWILPRCNCVLIPVTNTSTELLASWLTGEFIKSLPDETLAQIEAVTLELTETPGQSAIYRHVIG